jgi:prepilin-type N-terminal cleavage/methylation domain-containing protein
MKEKSKGFTLIELVVAVALLAILVSAAIAAFQNITQKAQMSRLKATLKSMRSAVVINKAQNELNNSTSDGFHPRVNFWPTFEEVRRASYENQLSNSILSVPLSDNNFISSPAPRDPPFDNTFVADTSSNICYQNPDVGGATNLANNLVVCTTVPKGSICPASNCQAGYAYNPTNGNFWANSSQFGSNTW